MSSLLFSLLSIGLGTVLGTHSFAPLDPSEFWNRGHYEKEFAIPKRTGPVGFYTLKMMLEGPFDVKKLIRTRMTAKSVMSNNLGS